MFEEVGYKLISDTYKNARTKLIVECDKGHIYEPTFDNFRLGHRCSYCNRNGKISVNKLLELLKNLKYNIIDISTFQNSKSNITISCEKGHIFSTKWNYLNSGQGCPRCNGGSRISYEEIKNKIESVGYKLISDTYKNANSKIILKCDKGHEYETIYSNFYMGHRCPQCNGGIKLTYEDVKNRIELVEGYKLISKNYKNNHTKLLVLCPNNHKFEINLSDWKGGNRCKYCSYINGKSKDEKIIFEYIKTIYKGLIIENDRTQIINPKTGNYLELDIWLPELNLAIEYNGLYWHKIKYQKIKDQIKLNECKNKGILLFIITDEEWQNNQDEIKNKIKGLINYLQTDIKLLP